MKKLISLFIILLLLSCKRAEMVVETNYYFESPQPLFKNSLSKFPKEFQGLYNCDSTNLIVQNDVIVKEYLNRFSIHKKEKDSINNFIERYEKEGFFNKMKIVKSYDDSLLMESSVLDTIFQISANSVVKKMGTNLVLSEKDSIFWRVQFLKLNQNKIIHSNLSMTGDLKLLDSITSIKAKKLDSISYLITSNKREMKQILNIKNLGYTQEYLKIKR